LYMLGSTKETYLGVVCKGNEEGNFRRFVPRRNGISSERLDGTVPALSQAETPKP
jgi:hypothetical protein